MINILTMQQSERKLLIARQFVCDFDIHVWVDYKLDYK